MLEPFWRVPATPFKEGDLHDVSTDINGCDSARGPNRDVLVASVDHVHEVANTEAGRRVAEAFSIHRGAGRGSIQISGICGELGRYIGFSKHKHTVVHVRTAGLSRMDTDRRKAVRETKALRQRDVALLRVVRSE